MQKGRVLGATVINLRKNICSLFVLQGMNYLLPLLTVPYLVRVLGVEKYGLVAFAQVCMQYFIIFTDYGFNLSATRDIVLYRNDTKKTTQIFHTVLFVKCCILFFCLCILALLIASQPSFQIYAFFFEIAFFHVTGSVLFPIWFFQGIEKMHFITWIYSAVRIVGVALIFWLVEGEQDYIWVMAIQSGGSLVAGSIALGLCYRLFLNGLYFPTRLEIYKIVKSGWDLFAANLMSSLIANGGIFILGLYGSHDAVGIYAAIEKVIKGLQGLFGPITQALFPYSTNKFKESYIAGRNFLLRIGVYLIGVIGFISISVYFAAPLLLRFLYGNNMVLYANIMQGLCLWLFLGVLNNIIGIQYLLALGKVVQYRRAFSYSAMLTAVIFFLLIPDWSYFGIVWGMNIGELVLTLIIAVHAYQCDRHMKEIHA